MIDDILKMLSVEQEKLKGVDQLLKCIQNITNEKQVIEIAEVINEIIKSKEFHSGFAHTILEWQVKSGILK